jgi:putative membrane protein
MKVLFIRWLILTLAVILASYLIPGIRVSGFFSALFTAAILGILNMLFRPILLVLTLPINLLTFGLFTFVINALMLMMASGVVSGLTVESFWSALFGALVISAVNWITNRFINDQGKVERQDYLEMTQKDDGSWE